MSITASLNGNITITDASTGTVALVKLLSGLSVTGTSFMETQSASVGTGGSSITLPASPTNFLYIKNTHITNTLEVTWTPNGGSSIVAQTLEPNSAILYCQLGISEGITALTLTGSASATTCEFVLAG